MKSLGRLFLLVPLLTQLMTGAVLGQTATPPPPEPDEKIWEYFLRLTGARATEPVAEATADRVAAKTTATVPPEGFAGRVNDAISDFLPWLQFAVNSVSTSEDEGSVTVKFNPFELGAFGPVSLAATATEPAVFEPFTQEIVEPAREAEVKALLAGADDFSDVTWAAEYSYARKAVSWNRSRKLFGRSTKIYEPLITELLTAGIEEVLPQQAAVSEAFIPLAEEILEIQRRTGRADVRDVTFAEIRALVAPGQRDDKLSEKNIVSKLFAATKPWQDLDDAITGLNLAALPALIDNQPQFVLKGSYRDAQKVVGPTAWTATLSYEMGTNNLNAVLREYRARRAEDVAYRTAATPAELREAERRLRLEAFKQVTSAESLASEDRFVFALTYKDADPYSFSHPYTETVTSPDAAPVEVERTASLSLPGSTEWCGRATWTRFLRTRKAMGTDIPEALDGAADFTASSKEQPKEEKPRLSFTLERVQVSGDPKLQDRTVGRLTLTLPSAGNMTMPISITYADRPELLGSPDKTFGAHIGISYKLNRGGGAQ